MKITVLHNISRDGGFGINEVPGPAGKTYQAGSHQLVKVFEFTADGMTPDQVFHAFNVGDDPAYSVSAAERELAGAYRARRLRALSFPGKQACCGWSCCTARTSMLSRLVRPAVIWCCCL